MNKVGTEKPAMGRKNCMLKHELLSKDQRWVDDMIQHPASESMN